MPIKWRKEEIDKSKIKRAIVKKDKKNVIDWAKK